MRGVRAVLCAIALAAFVVPNAHADEYTKQTFLTFSGPVQLPGITLPAGTYMFKLADPDSGRRTLQVSDKDGTKVYATLLTIPDQKMEPSDKPVVMFSERPAGEAQAIRAWFYPGERFGEEFVYPKDQAVKIAKENHTSVMAYNEASPKAGDAAAMHSAKVGRIDEHGQPANESTAAENHAAAAPATTAPAQTGTTASADRAASSSTAPAPTSPHPSQQTAMARADAAGTAPVGTSGSAQANQSDRGAAAAAPRTLPRTASPLGLFELLSGLTLAAGVSVRQLRKRLVSNR